MQQRFWYSLPPTSIMSLDAQYPTKTYSLPAFINHFNHFLKPDQFADDPVHQYTEATDFALTGTNRSERKNAVIDCYTHGFKDANVANINRDYDSLLGFTDRIPISKPLSVSITTDNRDTLTTSIHIFLPDGYTHLPEDGSVRTSRQVVSESWQLTHLVFVLVHFHFHVLLLLLAPVNLPAHHHGVVPDDALAPTRARTCIISSNSNSFPMRRLGRRTPHVPELIA